MVFYSVTFLLIEYTSSYPDTFVSLFHLMLNIFYFREMDTDCFFGFTVIVIFLLAGLYVDVAAAFTVIVAFPGPFRETVPLLLTVAAFLLELV